MSTSPYVLPIRFVRDEAEHPAAIKLTPEILLNGANLGSSTLRGHFSSLVYDDKVWKLFDDE